MWMRRTGQGGRKFLASLIRVFRIHKKNGVGEGNDRHATQLTSPEAISTEDKYWELKKTTGSEMQV
jgi:hypothetical protein